MKVIPVVSLKGGVGKSTVAAGLSKALHRAGFSVGALDVDFHAPNLPLIFNCTAHPRRSRGNLVVPPVTDGIKLLSWAMLWPEDTAVTVEDVQVGPDDLLPIADMLESGCVDISIVSVNDTPVVVLQREVLDMSIKMLRRLAEHPGGAIEHVAHLLQPEVVDWGDLDFLVVDTPPESTGIVRVVAESKGVSGALIVSHASTVSCADVRRTVDLFRKTQIPVYGLVVNQLGEHDLTESDMRAFAFVVKLPIIATIPHTNDTDGYFDRLAQIIVSTPPITLAKREVVEDITAFKSIRKIADLLEVLKL